MNVVQSVWAVDAHTTGSPIRVITAGIPPLPGNTISSKMTYMREHYDDLRKMVTQQPRGFLSLVCAVLVPPVTPEADFGVFYMDADTYQPMCGAGTLAAAKVLVETGMVKAEGKGTTITFDTAAGRVRTFVERLEDGTTNVAMVNAPAFVYEPEVSLWVEALGRVSMDICFGGNFFAIVDVDQLGYGIEPTTIPNMLTDMKRIVAAVKKNMAVKHPLNPEIDYLDECLFVRNRQDADGGYLGQCIYGDGLYDISPCGTGTCARLAQRYQKGLLKQGEAFIHKQTFGGTFTGTVLKEVRVGSYHGIIPQVVCGDIHITGFNQLIAEEKDRLRFGFKTW